MQLKTFFPNFFIPRFPIFGEGFNWNNLPQNLKNSNFLLFLSIFLSFIAPISWLCFDKRPLVWLHAEIPFRIHIFFTKSNQVTLNCLMISDIHSPDFKINPECVENVNRSLLVSWSAILFCIWSERKKSLMVDAILH